MRKLKAILCIFLVVCLLGGGIFSLFYFSRGRDHRKVVVTIFPLYDICREILGSEEDIMLLESTGVDMHSYQPSAQEITAIMESEIFIYVGGASDFWVDDVLASSSSVNLKTLRMMDSIDKLEESMDGIVDSEEHDNEHENHEEEYDEHIWLSIKNMIDMTNAMLDSLIDIFPHIQELLKENASNYIDKLQALENEYSDVFKDKETTVVFADRFPFTYLAKDYGMKYLGAFHGCSSDTEASVSIISKLIDKINEEELKYICVLENSDKAIAESVIGDTRCRDGVQILVIDSCQSVSSDDLNVMNYIDIMEKNLVNFKKALNNEFN